MSHEHFSVRFPHRSVIDLAMKAASYPLREVIAALFGDASDWGWTVSGLSEVSAVPSPGTAELLGADVRAWDAFTADAGVRMSGQEFSTFVRDVRLIDEGVFHAEHVPTARWARLELVDSDYWTLATTDPAVAAAARRFVPGHL